MLRVKIFMRCRGDICFHFIYCNARGRQKEREGKREKERKENFGVIVLCAFAHHARNVLFMDRFAGFPSLPLFCSPRATKWRQIQMQ